MASHDSPTSGQRRRLTGECLRLSTPTVVVHIGVDPEPAGTPRQVSLLGQACAAGELLTPIYGQLFHAGSMPSSAASPSIVRRTSVSADLTEFALR